MATTKAIKTHVVRLTPLSHTQSEQMVVNDAAGQREIRVPVITNKQALMKKMPMLARKGGRRSLHGQMKIPTCALLLLISTSAHSIELVKVCNLGTQSAQRIEVVRDAPIEATHIYYLRQNGKSVPFFGTPEQSRGSNVVAHCAGKDQHALVVSGEFTANALQGFVVTQPSGLAGLERLDFAEKNRPSWLYLSSHELMIVIASSGYGETNGKYVVYRHFTQKAERDRVDATNVLPSPRGFEQIKLRAR